MLFKQQQTNLFQTVNHVIYVTENIQSKQIDIYENSSECVGVTITLFPEKCHLLFFQSIDLLLLQIFSLTIYQKCLNKTKVKKLYLGDFNLNRLDKARRN